MSKPLVIAIEQLVKEPYSSIICYPRPCRTEVRKRLRELQKLRITALEFVGRKQVLNLPILGKGCVGIVVLAHNEESKVAVKIRRIDADRQTMQREAELLEKANSVRVGPTLSDVSENFLLMQFVDGTLLEPWLESCRSETRIRKILWEILEQCWRLDKIGLDHGELSHAPKHIVVNKKGKPFVLDFETASTNRKPSNVTSICQFLFLNSEAAKKITARLGDRDKQAIIKALKDYKNHKTFGNLNTVRSACGL